MSVKASVPAACLAAHQRARSKPHPIPHGSRGSCAAAAHGSLGLQEKAGSQDTTSSAQPHLVGLGQAMEGAMATYQLCGTSLSLSSTYVWGPVVPSRLWARLGSALHDDKSHWDGFHVSLEQNEAKLKILLFNH